jgi:serine/threonine-protein kinase
VDTSHFSKPQYNISNAEPLDVNGATSNCFKIKLYGKWHFLKQLKAELRTNPRYVAAMHKEFETGYNLDHPHLVRYVACGDDYLLTEWVDGITLKEFANVNPEFFKSRDNTNRLLDELLDVVQYLHSHQIVHLDLKPENILITRVGNELKLTDLGFCYTDAFTDTTGRTDSFASPEQLEDRGEVDARSDIWSLGILLSKMFPGYRRIARKCTRPKAEERYSSASEVFAAVSRRRRFGRWAGAAAAAVIAAGIGLGIFMLNQKSAGEIDPDALFLSTGQQIEEYMQNL